MTIVYLTVAVLGLLGLVAGAVFFFRGLKVRAVAGDAKALADAEAKKLLETARTKADAEIRRAEADAKRAELDAKERILKAREAAEIEAVRRRSELTDIEKRILSKEDSLDKKLATAEKREQDAENRAKNLDKR